MTTPTSSELDYLNDFFQSVRASNQGNSYPASSASRKPVAVQVPKQSPADNELLWTVIGTIVVWLSISVALALWLQ